MFSSFPLVFKFLFIFYYKTFYPSIKCFLYFLLRYSAGVIPTYCLKNVYSDAHFNSFIQEADIKRISEMGFDHVRVPVDYNVLETETGEVIESAYGKPLQPASAKNPTQ